MNTERVRFGLLGYGEHAARVCPAFAETNRCELRAVASCSAEKRRCLSELSTPIETHSTYEALLQDDTIDVVYICLPNHLHTHYTLLALQAGKHVLCEKPLALTKHDALCVADAARENQRFAFEAFAYRFHPQHEIVRALLHEGAIGSLQTLRASYSYSLEDTSNIRLQAACGGGALADAGCYLTDLANLFFENLPDRIIGSWQFDPSIAVDRSVELVFHYQSGTSARLYAANNAARQNSYELQGSEGRITVVSAFHMPRHKVARIQVESAGGKKQDLSIAAANQFVLEFDAVAKIVSQQPSWQDPPQTIPGSPGFPEYVQNATLLELSRNACLKQNNNAPASYE